MTVDEDGRALGDCKGEIGSVGGRSDGGNLTEMFDLGNRRGRERMGQQGIAGRKRWIMQLSHQTGKHLDLRNLIWRGKVCMDVGMRV